MHKIIYINISTILILQSYSKRNQQINSFLYMFNKFRTLNKKNLNKSKCLSVDPYIITIDNFLSLELCNYFINLGNKRMERGLDFNYLPTNKRQCSVSFFQRNQNKKIKELVDLISSQIRLSKYSLEPIQVSHYSSHEYYAYHHDAFPEVIKSKTITTEHPQKKFWISRERLGLNQRIYTAIIYLNKPKAGGETRFDVPGINIEPEIGKLAIFRNVLDKTNKMDPNSSHSGLPVLEGEKWILTMWYNSFTIKGRILMIIKVIRKKLLK